MAGESVGLPASKARLCQQPPRRRGRDYPERGLKGGSVLLKHLKTSIEIRWCLSWFFVKPCIQGFYAFLCLECSFKRRSVWSCYCFDFLAVLRIGFHFSAHVHNDGGLFGRQTGLRGRKILNLEVWQLSELSFLVSGECESK